MPINSGVLLSLLRPHLSTPLTDSLPSLNLLCHSKTDARWSKSSLKHSIRFYGIFPSLKQNFIAYRSSKVSDCIFEIHQLWQSGLSRVYSTCCCSCWFKPEIIKIGQSSHKMYSNNILNFQDSTTILNARTKMSGNLSYDSRIFKYIANEEIWSQGETATCDFTLYMHSNVIFLLGLHAPKNIFCLFVFIF